MTQTTLNRPILTQLWHKSVVAVSHGLCQELRTALTRDYFF